jgi:hypothetical protein
MYGASDVETARRVRLRRTGFHPLPLSGKRPSMDKWSEKINVNQDEIKLWQKLYPWAANTGILTCNTPTIDIDILDEEAAKAIELLVRDLFEEKGLVLVRIGNPPKRAIPMRTDNPFKKITTKLLPPEGKPEEQKVEILCDGQQVVVWGLHPDTGKPYGWFGGELGDITRDQLPYIHAEEAADLIARIEELLVREFGYRYPPPALVMPGARPNGAAQFHHADWTELVSNIITSNKLHDSIRDLAASFAANAIPQDCAARLLQAFMLASPLPRDERWHDRLAEVTHAILSGYEKFRRGLDKPAVLRFVDMRAWDAIRAPERAWAVRDRIPIRQATLLSGEGSIGKTILELQLCVAHVLGRDWIGALPEQGPAIYLGAEDDADELHRRLQAIVDAFGLRFQDLVANGLHVMSFAGEDCLLGVPNRSGQIVATALYEKLLEAVNDIKPKHIGIDTSADVFAGNEIDRGQVRQFLSLLRKLGMVSNGSVVLLAHPSIEGIRSGTGLSGSTGWHNSVRARMYFRAAKRKNGDDDVEPDPNARELEFMKNNYGPVAETMKLEFHNGIFRPRGSGSPYEDKTTRAKRAEDTFLSVFVKLQNQGKTDFSPKSKAEEYLPRQIARHPDGREFTVRDYAEAMEKLLATHKLHIIQVGSGQRKRDRVVLGPKPGTLELT